MGYPASDRKLTLFSVSPDHERSVLRPQFVASTSAFLKLNGQSVLLVGQSNIPSPSIAFSVEPISIAVRLPIGMQSLLLNEPASEITNDVRMLDLPEITEIEGDFQLNRLLPTIKQLILRKYSLDRNFALVDEIVQAAVRMPSCSVAELSKRCGYSSRHLQRIFLRYTGFSTKEFLEIRRFENSIEQSNSKDLGNPGVSVEPQGSYYDQSHYIKNFKRFSGEPPRQFLKRMSDPYNTNAASPFIMDTI